MSEQNNSANAGESQSNSAQSADAKTESTGAQGTSAEMSSNNEIDNLKAQVEKFKNDYLYLRAEFDNYRRNAIKERSELVKYGSERVLIDILGVLDNFERAIENKPTAENLTNYVKGIEMTQAEFKSALVKHGVSEIPSQGAAFDPSVHEALSSEESTEIKPGFITRVFKKPYKLHEKVIRTGQVIVAREPSN